MMTVAMFKYTEGYWKNDYQTDLPFPQANESPWEGQQEFIEKLKMIEAKAKEEAYRGFSTCRICGCLNGSREYYYNGWRWPQGFMHYIVEHNVQPTIEFQAFINEEADHG